MDGAQSGLRRERVEGCATLESSDIAHAGSGRIKDLRDSNSCSPIRSATSKKRSPKMAALWLWVCLATLFPRTLVLAYF